MQSPYTVRSCGVSNVKTVIPLDEVIDCFNIVTVFSGTLHYCIDKVDYTLKKGDTLIIRPGSHHVRYASDAPAHYYPMDYFSDGVEEAELPTLIRGCSSKLKDAVAFMDKTFRDRNTPYHQQKTGLAVHLFLLTLKEEIENSKLSFHVQQIIKYISENYTNHITLDDIANNVHLTTPYCCHLVKKELNTTIYELILSERISLAQNYILSGEVPLNEIPAYCGFSDYSHFYKCFKKRIGISPIGYRNKSK